MSDPLTDEIHGAMALITAQIIVNEERLRQLDAEEAEIEALGIDLDALQEQAKADSEEQAGDQLLLDQAQQLLAMAGLTDDEYAKLNKLVDGLEKRADARQARVAERGRNADAVLAIQAKYRGQA